MPHQLTQIELPAGDVVTHVWSPVNKNAEERIVEQDDGVTVTRFLWDNNNVVRETDEVGAVEAEYTYPPEPFGDLVSQRRATDSSTANADRRPVGHLSAQRPFESPGDYAA